MTYETAHLTYKQAKEFCRRFDLEIGTERELNNIDIDTYYVFCVELDSTGELNACKKFELASLRVGE